MKRNKKKIGEMKLIRITVINTTTIIGGKMK